MRADVHLEAVVTVDDADEAAAAVRTLLLAGIGAEPCPVGARTEIRVVTGDGARAREFLGVPEPRATTFAALVPAPRPPTDPGRHLMARVLVIWALAFTMIPALGFFVAYWLGTHL